jgi:ABC-type multidrug transport system ATPase subunit
LLDEPHTGLDPHACEMLDGLLEAMRGRRTILMTTHDLRLAVGLADRYAILAGGAVVHEGRRGEEDPEALRDHYFRALEGAES